MPLSIESGIEAKWRARPGSDSAIWDDHYIGDYQLEGDFGARDLKEALRLAELLDTPAGKRDCAKELGRLRLVTAARQLAAEDLTLQIAVMAEELSAYPLDAVRDACRVWPRGHKFFPTWAELRELCEERVLFRRALARALRRHLDTLKERDASEEAPPVKAPPACGVWQDNRTRLEALPGWPLLERCIADSDDGEILTLAVEAPGLGLAVLAWAAKDAEAVLERKIACVVHRWVQPALVERGVRIGVSPSIAAHRRDGETVTLDDPAWRVWSAGIGMVEGLPCEAAALACLPDDLDSEGLVLAVPSFREAKVILDHPQDLAKAFGVTVRKRFMSWIDVANKVRAINQ